MSRVRDNWERLVVATLDREKLRELAMASSRETSFSSSSSARFDSPFHFKFGSVPETRSGESYIVAAILLADQVANFSEITTPFNKECLKIKSKAKKVASLLREAMPVNHQLYHRPTRHVMFATEDVLKKAMTLLLKCRGIRRLFRSITGASFQDISSQLEYSIANISWLLRGHQYRGVPPMAADEPVLCNIWELIAVLHTGSVDDQCNALASLASLARENEAYRTLIVEEGGLQPLLTLAEKGTRMDVQENAVRAIVLLGIENWEQISNKVQSVFMAILKSDSHIKLQGTVAWAVSELPWICEYYEHEKMFIHLLRQLAFRILPEDIMVHILVAVSGVDNGMKSHNSRSRSSNRATETKEEDETDDYVQTMVTRALWRLARQKLKNCQIMANSKAVLSYLAFFLDKGPDEANYNSAMALMEITAAAEKDFKLRSAFRLKLPINRAVVDQVLRVIDLAELDDIILIPCVTAIGNLARTFPATKATEVRIINPLVKLLDARDAKVSGEVCIALTKFVHSYNFLCMEHSRSIVNAGGVNLLVQLVSSGEQTETVQHHPGLMLLCYIALNIRSSEELGEANMVVAAILERASKQASLIQVEEMENLLPKAITNLEIYRVG